MQSSSNENHIKMALQAIKQDPNLSIKRASEIYEVPRTTLIDRRNGINSKRDVRPKSMILTTLEEDTILERIINLIERGFPPRLDDVRDMANLLLETRGALPVGSRWADRFVQRQNALKLRFQRRIDYQRALTEDPTVIQAWFALVRNIMNKYGIQDSDIYNFDETGFLMGMLSYAKVLTTSDRKDKPRTKQPGNREWVTVIQSIYGDGWAILPYVIVKNKCHLLSWYTNGDLPTTWRVHPSENGWTTNEIGLDWIHHFQNCTKSRATGKYRLLILDGHNSHRTAYFDEYCKENDIIPLCMPPHSSHILQPLDVGCFGPLKKAYGREIEKMMRTQITHITKDDFFPAFKQAFFATMGEENVRAGFRGTGLIPYDPERVIASLDFKPKTPTPSNSRPTTATSTNPNTPKTVRDAVRGSTQLKTKIARHQSSSPTHLYDLVDMQARGISKLAHKMVLLESEVKTLRTANKTFSKRRRAKKTRIRAEGSLNVLEANALQAQKVDGDRTMVGEGQNSDRTEIAKSTVRRCGNCSQPGHNARTCQIDSVTSEEEIDT